MAAAKYAVGKQLIDPFSAQFRDIEELQDGTVCGEFNAKNALGGYVGFRHFIYNHLPRYVVTEPTWADVDLWCNERQPKRKMAVLTSRLLGWEKTCAKGNKEIVKSVIACAEAEELREAIAKRRRIIQVERAALLQSESLWERLCERASDQQRKVSCQRSVDAKLAVRTHLDRFGE